MGRSADALRAQPLDARRDSGLRRAGQPAQSHASTARTRNHRFAVRRLSTAGRQRSRRPNCPASSRYIRRRSDGGQAFSRASSRSSSGGANCELRAAVHFGGTRTAAGEPGVLCRGQHAGAQHQSGRPARIAQRLSARLCGAGPRRPRSTRRCGRICDSASLDGRITCFRASPRRGSITRSARTRLPITWSLESSELIPAGPAALLSAPGFMAVEWDGQARLLPEGRSALAVTSAPAVCRAWQAATGDAGWGGVLAESALGSAVRPALLIYNPGTDVLRLMAEALALLPPERRWQVTFSSYYTRLPAGVDCLWRGLVAGSPECFQRGTFLAVLVIELTRPLGPAQGGALVAAARTGRVVADVKPSPAPAARALPAVEDVAYSIDSHHAQAPVASAQWQSCPPLADTGIELGPPPQYGTDLWQPPVTRHAGAKATNALADVVGSGRRSFAVRGSGGSWLVTAETELGHRQSAARFAFRQAGNLTPSSRQAVADRACGPSAKDRALAPVPAAGRAKRARPACGVARFANSRFANSRIS